VLRRRVIVCLDVRGDQVVKGVRFAGLRAVGDPAELAARYEAAGADEVVILDVAAAAAGRATLLDVVRRTAETLFVPLTVGGGIRELADVEAALLAGADKVSVNSAAVRRPALLGEAAERFGSQCVVASVDARREAAAFSSTGWGYRVFTHGGRQATGLDAVDWARRCAALGAGEVLITSIDEDGRREGYDLELTGAVVRAVTVPVIASGGAGCPEHLRDAFLVAGADAALVAGILHDGQTTVGVLKRALAEAGIPVRPAPAEAAA
jgi:imidazole glycerol-phosphate synthase subunit HisF